VSNTCSYCFPTFAGVGDVAGVPVGLCFVYSNRCSTCLQGVPLPCHALRLCVWFRLCRGGGCRQFGCPPHSSSAWCMGQPQTEHQSPVIGQRPVNGGGSRSRMLGLMRPGPIHIVRNAHLGWGPSVWGRAGDRNPAQLVLGVRATHTTDTSAL
jgi:hypothetical protein